VNEAIECLAGDLCLDPGPPHSPVVPDLDLEGVEERMEPIHGQLVQVDVQDRKTIQQIRVVAGSRRRSRLMALQPAREVGLRASRNSRPGGVGASSVLARVARDRLGPRTGRGRTRSSTDMRSYGAGLDRAPSSRC
jgi:hypothetical protein